MVLAQVQYSLYQRHYDYSFKALTKLSLVENVQIVHLQILNSLKTSGGIKMSILFYHIREVFLFMWRSNKYYPQNLGLVLGFLRIGCGWLSSTRSPLKDTRTQKSVGRIIMVVVFSE